MMGALDSPGNLWRECRERFCFVAVAQSHTRKFWISLSTFSTPRCHCSSSFSPFQYTLLVRRKDQGNWYQALPPGKVAQLLQSAGVEAEPL